MYAPLCWGVRGGGSAVAHAVARHGGKAGGWDYRLTVGHKQDNGFELRNDRQRLDLAWIYVQGDWIKSPQPLSNLLAGKLP